MISRDEPGRANIITHIHTDASTAQASELGDRISGAIEAVDGKDTAVTWSECFTSIGRLLELVRSGRGSRGPVHAILVTDHMRSRSHAHPLSHLAAAAKEQRLALGAELATCARDVDGRYKKGPEIVAYGGAELVPGPFGPYYGLSAELLEELYDTCLDDNRQELCTRRTRDLLLKRRIAHALCHPLDGNDLSGEGTFAIISEFAFVETVNGGFFADSARTLEAFVRLNNAIRAGASLPTAELSPAARRVVRHIEENGRVIQAWSGSDAHSHAFDRVVVSMAVGRQAPAELRPGDVFRAMVEQASSTYAVPGATGARPKWCNLGKAATPGRQLADILAIIARNLYGARRLLLKPWRYARILHSTASITRDELRVRQAEHERRRRFIEEEFDPAALLAKLDLPLALGPQVGWLPAHDLQRTTGLSQPS